MSQLFKSVYFSDYGETGSAGQCLTLAFGEKDKDLYALVNRLSSFEIRELLGHLTFEDIRAAAERDRLPTNTYCIRRLRERTEPQVREPGQLYLTFVYVDPVHATFKGGEAEPLHTWYPLLEGYSPQFVRQLIQEYAPSAQRVFDPFAGMGTTPLTAARMRLDSFYCEVNPLCQHLIKVKTSALTMSEKKREQVLSTLSKTSGELEAWLKSGPRDPRLEIAYQAAFGKSRFFTP